MITHEDVRAAAMSLPGVFERESYSGRPSWRTKPRMFAWIREEPEALVVWVDSVEEKDALIESEPAKFFTTEHYDGHPIVLVNLGAVDATEAKELLTESWRIRAPKRLVANGFDQSSGEQ